MLAAGKAARRAVLESYHAAVGTRFSHAVRSDDPRKRRRRRDHLTIRDQERELEATKAELAAKAAELVDVNAALEREKAETSRLRDQLRRVVERARSWFGALRGEPAAALQVAEAPTVSESRIDSALGVTRDHLSRRRVSSI